MLSDSPHLGGETVWSSGAVLLRVQHGRISTNPFRWTGASSVAERFHVVEFIGDRTRQKIPIEQLHVARGIGSY